MAKDPFDQMLAAQTFQGMILVTSDPLLTAYGVPTLWTQEPAREP